MFIRPEVMRFAEAMERKLKLNDYKGGWKGRDGRAHWAMPPEELLDRAEKEFEELKSCDIDNDVLDEAADVANYLMMMCDVRGHLKEVSDVGRERGESVAELKRKSGELMRSGNMSAAVKLYDKAWDKERKEGNDGLCTKNASLHQAPSVAQ